MTCIIAGSRMMIADRRIVDGEAISSMVKVAKNPHLIAAASGNATSTLAVKRAVGKGAKLPEDLIEHVDADSYALVLLPSGQLMQIQDGVIWTCKAGELHGIGSGADLALGYLQAAHDEALMGHDRDVIKRAFRFVSRKRTDCGGGVDFRSFER